MLINQHEVCLSFEPTQTYSFMGYLQYPAFSNEPTYPRCVCFRFRIHRLFTIQTPYMVGYTTHCVYYIYIYTPIIK